MNIAVCDKPCDTINVKEAIASEQVGALELKVYWVINPLFPKKTLVLPYHSTSLSYQQTLSCKFVRKI